MGKNDITKYRNQLIEISQEQGRSFDKHVLALAVGAFGLSLIFVDKIKPKGGDYCVLFWSWVFFGICIIVTLLSFRMAALACDKYRDRLDKYYSSGTTGEEPTFQGVLTIAVNILNWSSYCAFVIGTVLLFIFVIKSLS